jgi:transposase
VKKKILSASVFVDPSEIVAHLVGLKDVRVLSYARRGPAGELTIEQVVRDPTCPRCGHPTRVKERPVVSYTDLPFGGVPMTLRWKKHRFSCVNPACEVRSFTLSDHRLAAKGVMLTTRAAKWVVKEIASGQSVSHLAKELRCSWDSVNTATRVYGAALLAADTKRLKETTAIGLDETLFLRSGPCKKKAWSTTVCDVVNHQLIDIVPTREFTEVAGWLRAQPHHVKDRLAYGCLDMSRTYAAVFRVVTPKATQVVDRFHVMRHAILAVDEVRRRVQQQRLGHRGRSDDPLYKARKLLVIRATSTDTDLQSRLEGLLALGDPEGEVAFAYGVKEAVARFYDTEDPEAAADLLRDIIDYGSRKSAPAEVRRLARTLRNWFDAIVAWHQARVSNGPTEGMNNLIKRVTRRFRVHELRELSNTSPALCRQAQPQSLRLDRREMTGHEWPTPLLPEEPEMERATRIEHQSTESVFPAGGTRAEGVRRGRAGPR